MLIWNFILYFDQQQFIIEIHATCLEIYFVLWFIVRYWYTLVVFKNPVFDHRLPFLLKSESVLKQCECFSFSTYSSLADDLIRWLKVCTLMCQDKSSTWNEVSFTKLKVQSSSNDTQLSHIFFLVLPMIVD